MSEFNAKQSSKMVVMAAGLAVFSLFGIRTTFSVLQIPMSADLEWSGSQLTLGFSLMMTMYAITAYFTGMIIDRWGTRPAFAIGTVCAALGYLVTSFAQSYLSYLLPYAFFAGVGTGMLWVSSTISVRKWFSGKSYASNWGIAFIGAPIAQVFLNYAIKQVIAQGMDWRIAMRGLAAIIFLALFAATVLSRKNPQDYGYNPVTPGQTKTGSEKIWTVKEAFRTIPIWGVIVAFFGSVLGEFLIWSQIVKYFNTDVHLDLNMSTNLYLIIGLSGLVTMPLMGRLSDWAVGKLGNEAKARKYMIILAPVSGIVACFLLLMTKLSIVFAIVSALLFAIYWAIEAGGAAGYAGSIYGGKTLGKIWGLATLIVMATGPAIGSYTGAFLHDISGSYTYSIFFAIGAFTVSAVAASILPIAARPK